MEYCIGTSWTTINVTGGRGDDGIVGSNSGRGGSCQWGSGGLVIVEWIQ